MSFTKSYDFCQLFLFGTVGIPIGIAIIVLSWLLTGVYVFWTNSFYDKAVEEIKNKAR
ncbi:MAG: DUF485 domain-containing protein [Hydrogenobacter sp.]